jgi:hypothetical protein
MAKAKPTDTVDKPETKLAAASQAADAAGKYGREKAYELFQRDEKGLLKNVNYIFKDDGTVDWKAMIPEKYLVLNTEYFEKRQIQLPDSTAGLDDKQVLVLLGGIKELAKIRGVERITKRVVESSNDRAVVICGIEFVGNYETQLQPFIYEEVASATLNNTNAFSQLYLETIASNRAFVRAVRNALRIDIVGSDELSNFTPSNNNAETTSESEPWHALRDAAKNAITKKFPEGFKTFDEFKAALIEKAVEGADSWNDWKDVPASTIFKLISQLKKTTVAVAK